METPKIDYTTLIIAITGQVLSILISRTDLTPEDREKLVISLAKLDALRSKEQTIADGIL